MNTSRWRGPVLALAVAVSAVVATGVVPVLAHAEFVSSDPANGATLAIAPTTITLTFSEGLNAAKSTFSLNQNGANVATGKAASDGATTMTATGLSLAPGSYVIRWTSVAADGDLLRGTVTFTVLPPAPSPSTAAPSAPATTAASATPRPATAGPSVVAATPSPQPSSDPTPASSTGSDVLLPIVLALLVVAGVGAFVLRRSRRV